MSIIQKLRLQHNINRFYKTFGAVLCISPQHTKLHDLNSTDFLLGVQYDVLDILQDYEDCFDDRCHKMCVQLKKLYQTLTDILN